MAKTKRIRESKYGDSYDSRYYTVYKGLIVSKRALSDASKRGDVTKGFIKSIASKNPKAFAERPKEQVSGISDPAGYLTAIKDVLNKEPSKRKGDFRMFGKELERIQRTNLMATEIERLGASFGDIMRRTMNKAEREDLRRFMGWTKGFDLNKEGFVWNKEEKRFEKPYLVDGMRLTQYIYINYTPGQRYGAGKIEYGVE